MDLNGIPLFSLISGRMSWLSARQSVLAENVANGDTPNYVARDLKPLDFQNMISGQETSSTHLATTNVRHFDVRAGGRGPYEQEDAFGEGGVPTGNVVSVSNCFASSKRRVCLSSMGDTPSSFCTMRRSCRELS